ncbi:hemerythrin domain-containing protein [Tepidimicrobium xylanilyticum]|uniref:Iron-sulfur cluster repair di-iron protein n=1 Tax=Tepidimicrobium xylanilyticum TaxID=1123352 RepID=A0A1H3A4G4_9FIRM|nr:hemerythrin domain-containing protein [Tepidimicrobium xylanilyticum]SDX24652.1 iron-sulfur cluster repair di-iron protein [Tepidimicrobium xylanilyticum]
MENKINGWKNQSTTKIINSLTDNYHEYFRNIMKELTTLTTTILRVHGRTHRELSKVHRFFSIIQINLIQRMIKEKGNIFPLIKIYDKRPRQDLLEEILKEKELLESEEDNIKELFNKLSKVTNGYCPPEDGCATYNRTYENLKELESKVLEYLKIENEILYPRLEK